MGRLLLAVALLALLFGQSEAGLSPRLDSLRAEVFRQLDIPSAGTGRITAQVGNSAINRAITQVCRDVPALEKIDTLMVDSIALGPTLPSDFVRATAVNLSWEDSTVAGVYMSQFLWPLVPIEPDSVQMKRPTPEQIQSVKENPFVIQYYRTSGGILLLFPRWLRPAQATVFLEYQAMDTVLTAASSRTSVDQEWLEAVIMYACSLISKKRNNLDDSQMYMQAYNRLVFQTPVTREMIGEK